MKQKLSDEFEEDLDFYKENLLEEYLENDEISSSEEAFMMGYLE